MKKSLVARSTAALVLGAAATAHAGVEEIWFAGTNTLVVEGSSGDDAIVVSINGTLNIYEVTLSKAPSCTSDWANGVTTTVSRLVASYDASALDHVAFVGNAGDDYFRNDTGLPSYQYGGLGLDVLIGGSDWDFIFADYDGATTPASGGHCNVVYGNGGDDYLAGGVLGSNCSGRQYIYGGTGDDYIALAKSAGGDTTNNSSCNLVAEGGDGDDHFFGGTSWDDLEGGDGEDEIAGGSGDDDLDGGDDADQIDGGDGEDTIHGGYGADSLYGDGGEDTIYGEGDGDWIYGGDADDTLYGENGADRIYGEGGNDYMSGGSGNDKLYGGDGGTDNWCKGGSGNDTFSSCDRSLTDD